MALGLALAGAGEKMNGIAQYDVACIGGGLAGLSSAILLAQKGYRVILFEQKQYPFHRVCGEYISNESLRFLRQDSGIDLPDDEIAHIRYFTLTSASGKSLQVSLPLGGFGISRYELDARLAKKAAACGVHICQNEKVGDVAFDDTLFKLATGRRQITARVCLGSWGKKSNLDVLLNRSFARKPKTKSQNLVGVKYHVRAPGHPVDHIYMHNFPGGYCGFTKIEKDLYCVCWLATADVLQRAGQSIEKAEAEILSRNPALKDLFANAQKAFDKPVVISQVNLEDKPAVEDHILCVGDAAGMISPLSGNGMSIAMRTGKLAAELADECLCGKMSRSVMEQRYAAAHKNIFRGRISMGRILQRVFGKTFGMNLLIGFCRLFPRAAPMIIKRTHGEVF